MGKILREQIILSEEQERCLDDITEKILYENKSVYTLAAPAGTGKTSLIPYIMQRLCFSEEEVAFVSFTGKAVRVMRDKGLPAVTIHHLIYDAFKDRNDEWCFRKKSYSDLMYYRLIILDEVSMVSTKLMADLLFYRIPILCLGDPAQLPPILDSPNNFISKPDFVLTKIYRQAKGNSILDLATQIRETGVLRSSINDDDVTTIDTATGEKMTPSLLADADIFLCGTNRTKNDLTGIIRSCMGIKDFFPCLYEPIIITKNYWDILSAKKEPLTNGCICTITDIDYYVDDEFDKFARVTLVPTYDEEDYFNCYISLNQFYNLAEIYESKKRNLQRVHCDFAYAITIHKSQGSQFDNVVVYSKDAFGDRQKMLYTAVTRARKHLWYVQ